MKKMVLLSCCVALFIGTAGISWGAEKPTPKGFIPEAPKALKWEEAKNFCESQGARLPRVDKSDSLAKISTGTPIEGFGAYGGEWSPDVSRGTYWTGTTASAASVDAAWVVYTKNGKTITLLGGPSDSGYDNKQNTNRVLCVPK
jgi:hypothetical protein